ncbi:MAG: hypothetical protein IJZ29_02985 [Clostridia bacterium]|nr:hypothetical protein [Clostridia bacterium]
MFDVINTSFTLCPAEYIKNISKLESEKDLALVSRYFDYCDHQLESIVNDLNELATTNESDLSVADFESVYQNLIENRLEDITGEMFLIQSLIAELDAKNPLVKQAVERIDMVTAMLLVVPEKVEKTKCLMRAFEATDDYAML